MATALTTLVSRALGKRDQSSFLVTQTVQAAQTLGSSLRVNEAAETYEQMLAKWSHEHKVKALADLFH